jgi:hypothetical protein
MAVPPLDDTTRYPNMARWFDHVCISSLSIPVRQRVKFFETRSRCPRPFLQFRAATSLQACRDAGRSGCVLSPAAQRIARSLETVIERGALTL